MFNTGLKIVGLILLVPSQELNGVLQLSLP